MPDPRLSKLVSRLTVNQGDVSMGQEVEANDGEKVSIGILTSQQVTKVTCERKRTTVIQHAVLWRVGCAIKIVQHTRNHTGQSLSATEKHRIVKLFDTLGYDCYGNHTLFRTFGTCIPKNYFWKVIQVFHTCVMHTQSG